MSADHAPVPWTEVMTAKKALTRLVVGVLTVLVNTIQAVQGDQDPFGWMLLGAGIVLALDGATTLWRLRS